MRQSKLFSRTLRQPPHDEEAVNAALLTRGGFVEKLMAGVYSYLPLGLRVLCNIENIVREEMNAVGGQELLLPALQPKKNWEATGRWRSLDVLFKIEPPAGSSKGISYALGPTHEEVVTPLARSVISSYKDLPLAVYQIQTKFRDEPRAKSGLLRTREFRMKDLYSFHASEEDLERYYREVAVPAYHRVYRRLELTALLTEAAGGTFSKFSHEFQVEIENGEDVIYVCGKCGLAKNKEIYAKGVSCTDCRGAKFREARAEEVGNIFPLKTKYSSTFGVTFTDAAGKKKEVVMGCYGIGTSRLMGVLAEKFHDERGLLWPEAVAPFRVHLLEFPGGLGEKRYQDLQRAGVGVLYDDRQASPGEKLADADLVGIPYRFIVSEKNGDKVEVKKRNEKKTRLVSAKEAAALAQR